jgi:hypothetical protein
LNLLDSLAISDLEKPSASSCDVDVLLPIVSAVLAFARKMSNGGAEYQCSL